MMSESIEAERQDFDRLIAITFRLVRDELIRKYGFATRGKKQSFITRKWVAKTLSRSEVWVSNNWNRSLAEAKGDAFRCNH
jgi:hypothetical protein